MKIITSALLLLASVAVASANTRNKDSGLLRGSFDGFKDQVMDAKKNDTDAKFAEIARAYDYEAPMKNSMEELHVDNTKFDVVSDALEDIVNEEKEKQVVDEKFVALGTSQCLPKAFPCTVSNDTCCGKCMPDKRPGHHNWAGFCDFEICGYARGETCKKNSDCCSNSCKTTSCWFDPSQGYKCKHQCK